MRLLKTSKSMRNPNCLSADPQKGLFGQQPHPHSLVVITEFILNFWVRSPLYLYLPNTLYLWPLVAEEAFVPTRKVSSLSNRFISTTQFCKTRSLVASRCR